MNGRQRGGVFGVMRKVLVTLSQISAESAGVVSIVLMWQDPRELVRSPRELVETLLTWHKS